MGLTFRYFHNPLMWRNCPSCKVSLVDDEISDGIAQFCEPKAFHSRLLGGRNKETWKMEYWQCPDCHTVFPADEKPVIHSMSDVFLESDKKSKKKSSKKNEPNS